MLIAILVVISLLLLAICAFFVVHKIRQTQRISQVFQMNLHAIPLARALLYACVSEQNLFLDTTYLQRNKQNGLCYQVPIHAMALTRGGIVIFQYLQTPDFVMSTDGNQWNVKNGPSITSIPNPFLRMEFQARTLLSMLKQTQMANVPIHAYVVLLNDRTQILQSRDDVIFASDIPSVIQKYNRSKLIPYFQLRKISQMLTSYQYTPTQNAQEKKA